MDRDFHKRNPVLTPEDKAEQLLDEIEAQLRARFDEMIETGIDPSILMEHLTALGEAYAAVSYMGALTEDDE